MHSHARCPHKTIISSHLAALELSRHRHCAACARDTCCRRESGDSERDREGEREGETVKEREGEREEETVKERGRERQ
jgi:hypothetical protein